MAGWLADKFNKNFDEYDAAIDAIYNKTHIGGSRYHHLIDGQHDIFGAFAREFKGSDPEVSPQIELKFQQFKWRSRLGLYI
jgi:hypothetical protein